MRGKQAPWSEDDRILREALTLASRPMKFAPNSGYGRAIIALETALQTMNELQGDELKRYADRHLVSKPELVEAIEKLSTWQRQARQQFSREQLRQLGPGTAA
jgi:hypothetical protein